MMFCDWWIVGRLYCKTVDIFALPSGDLYIYICNYIYTHTRSLKVGRVGDETMFVTGTFLTLLLSVTFWVSNQNGLTGQVLVMQP